MNKKIIRFIIAWLYKKILRPILFLIDPERVHDYFSLAGNLLGRYQATRTICRWLFSYQHPNLEQKVLGQIFKNPIGLSAGFDKDACLVKLLPSIGFGFTQVGSVTAKPYGGNPKPRLRRLPQLKSIIVNYGLKNIGARQIISKLQNETPDKIPLSISIAKTNSPETADDESGILDYVECFSLINNAGVGDFYTLNISCPNTFNGEPFNRPIALDQLLAQIKQLNITKPLLVKMPIDLPWPDFKTLLDIIIKHQCQGVVIGNLFKKIQDPSIKDHLPQNVKGGLSGLPTQAPSNQLISQTYQYCGDQLIIVGVGGIFSADDAYEKIKRGATLVQLITGMIYEGPQLIGQINQGLVQLLKQDGYSNISEAIGTLPATTPTTLTLR